MAEDKKEENPELRSAAEDNGVVISDTDIVFDCPHCGHNLVIDYRGAGLQINCVECGEPVLVPIPSGMNIDDLDLEPGEILKQLFATRRNMQKLDALVGDYEIKLAKITAHVNAIAAILRGEDEAGAAVVAGEGESK